MTGITELVWGTLRKQRNKLLKKLCETLQACQDERQRYVAYVTILRHLSTPTLTAPQQLSVARTACQESRALPPVLASTALVLAIKVCFCSPPLSTRFVSVDFLRCLKCMQVCPLHFSSWISSQNLQCNERN